MTGKDIVASIPSVVAARLKQEKDIARPMIGVPMVGDPTLPNDARDIDYTTRLPVPQSLFERRMCQYATAMLVKNKILDPNEFKMIDAIFDPPATVIFVRADRDQAEVARFVVPDRIMSFDPHMPTKMEFE